MINRYAEILGTETRTSSPVDVIAKTRASFPVDVIANLACEVWQSHKAVILRFIPCFWDFNGNPPSFGHLP